MLRLVARGRSTREIARELLISPKTADHHAQHIYTKIAVSTRASATLFALQHDLLRDQPHAVDGVGSGVPGSCIPALIAALAAVWGSVRSGIVALMVFNRIWFRVWSYWEQLQVSGLEPHSSLTAVDVARAESASATP